MKQGAVGRHWQVTLAPSTSVRTVVPSAVISLHMANLSLAPRASMICQCYDPSESMASFCFWQSVNANLEAFLHKVNAGSEHYIRDLAAGENGTSERAVLKDSFFRILLSPWIVTLQCQISRKHGLYRQYCSKTFLHVSAPLWAIV